MRRNLRSTIFPSSKFLKCTSRSSQMIPRRRSALRAPSHHTVVVDWVPPAERRREAPRGRRRWERPEATALAHSGGGGWVARHLTTLLRSCDVNVQAAALTALASLVEDSHNVAVHLARASTGNSTSRTQTGHTLATTTTC